MVPVPKTGVWIPLDAGKIPTISNNFLPGKASPALPGATGTSYPWNTSQKKFKIVLLGLGGSENPNRARNWERCPKPSPAPGLSALGMLKNNQEGFLDRGKKKKSPKHILGLHPYKSLNSFSLPKWRGKIVGFGFFWVFKILFWGELFVWFVFQTLASLISKQNFPPNKRQTWKEKQTIRKERREEMLFKRLPDHIIFQWYYILPAVSKIYMGLGPRM